MTTLRTYSDYIAQLRDAVNLVSTQAADRAGFPQFDELALALFSLQFEDNGAYRGFCEGRGAAPGTVRHWSEIPAIPAVAFKECELTSLPSDERRWVFHSSGTTEQRPSRHFHSAESLALYESSLLAWFRVCFDADRAPLRFLFLTPPPELAPHSSLVHMLATITSKLGSPADRFTGGIREDGGWVVDAEPAIDALRDVMATGGRVAVLGTAFNFVQLMDGPAKSGLNFRLPTGSCVMETGGYKGRTRALSKSELHSAISITLGVPQSRIVSEYGMSELSSQAYDLQLGATDCPSAAGRIFRFPPWARGRVVSPETGREVADGETGLIRVFDLANLRSVLAVQTEDLAIRRGEGFALLGRAALAEPRGCSLMSV
jgi:hypothetical protein